MIEHAEGDKRTHGLAQALCYADYGDWRYDPGNPEHIKRWYAEAERWLKVREAGYVTAIEVAQRLGVTRGWVYEHADELGAVRLGSGPKPRLRFDPERAFAFLSGSAPSPERVEPSPPKPAARSSVSGGPLLPIRRISKENE